MAIKISNDTVIDNSKNVNVGAAASVTVGTTVISQNRIGIGATDTTGRNAGIGTVTGTIIYNESTSSIEYWDGGSWIPLKQIISATASGVSSATATANVYTFYSAGTLTLAGATPTTTADIIVVAGGGGGAATQGAAGGGGGAGGVIVGTGITLPSGTYTISIGAGGPSATGGEGGNGSPSFILLPNPPSAFSSITAYGGARGSNGDGYNGGSGGGAGVNIYGSRSGGIGNRITNTSTVTRPQGNPGGGAQASPDSLCGGGGGAGSAGNLPGPGGNGTTSSISGISYTYGGGGGGGRRNSGGGTGGPGGGGNGVSYTTAGSGTNHLGGGGGGVGANWPSPNYTSGAGGIGVVIISIPK